MERARLTLTGAQGKARKARRAHLRKVVKMSRPPMTANGSHANMSSIFQSSRIHSPVNMKNAPRIRSRNDSKTTVCDQYPECARVGERERERETAAGRWLLGIAKPGEIGRAHV
jgi:hypothetical protein